MELALRDAILLCPPAVALHVFEEWPGFPRWARRFGSPHYSDRAYGVTHAFAVALAAASALLVRAFPQSWLVFLVFTLVVGPGLLWNAFFHAGASVLSRQYCPGAVTGLFVYLPLALLLFGLALAEGRIGVPGLALSLVLAAVFHTLEVGRNVFVRW